MSDPQSPVAGSDDKPLSFTEVLASEYQAIRGIPVFRASDLQELQSDVGKDEAPLSALCISGGGIRSAIFSLGILQGLAEKDLLGRFDYLSTVSGGGYIGGWLTAWKHRAGGIDKIQPKLRPTTEAPENGPDPIQHLREYNNYLSPKLGLFSSDTWTLVATVARNMFLNWLVLVPLLAFALMLPRIVLSLAMLGQIHDWWTKPDAATWEYLLVVLGVALLATAIFNMLRYLPGVGGKNHSQADFLKYCLAPIVFASLAFITLEAWFTGGDFTNGATSLTYRGLLTWMTGSCLAGWIAYIACFPKKILARPRLVPAMTFALVLTGVSTASCARLLLHWIIAWPLYVTVTVPLLLLSFGLALAVFVGLTSNILQDDDREWLSRAAAWLLLFIVAWAGASALVLLAPTWIMSPKVGNLWRSAIAAAGGLSGVITALGNSSSKAKAGKPGAGDGQQNSNFLGMVTKIATLVFIMVYLTALSLLTNCLLTASRLVTAHWSDHHAVLENTGEGSALIVAAAFLAFAVIMARFININKFSLHAMYRDRLIRAFLGASNSEAEVNKFTGFSENDNVGMSDLVPVQKPFHVINTTLNLVAGKRLAWQQRKAEPFTVSALHCGNSGLGYRRSAEYGGRGGMSLGTAITLSGAAASPNMGYYSSPLVGFIMTLFNARLGAWLGNPRSAGAPTWRQEGPRSAVNSLVREAFGLTNDTSPYIYLSDGGHFENLALYEMVKRGCRLIIVIDGAADPDFKYNDLGNALRKIRIDMKIPIEFSTGQSPAQNSLMQPLIEHKKRCALATIRYQDVDPQRQNGYLVYIKPMMRGNEPPDVAAYQAVNPAFPHQSTADQWFDESQTESYRMLAYHTMKEMCEDWNPRPNAGIPEFMTHIENQYLRDAGQAAAAGAGK